MPDRQREVSVVYETPEAFQREYVSNVSNGGIFVIGEDALEVQDRVGVTIQLDFADRNERLEGEVVHVVPQDLAGAGAKPGAAIHFDLSARDVRELFEPFLIEPAPSPEEEEEAHGRRSAPRSRTRVRARIVCPGHPEIETRTRNLSASGVLISVRGEEAIDVGEPVQVFITDPRTGEEREILGKIARHVEGEGGVVRAIGIEFFLAYAERTSVERFIAGLMEAEHNRHLGGIQGSIEELGLASLIQTFCVAAPEGTLDVIRGAEEGYLAFEKGMLRAVEIAGVRGVKALARMLSWRDGRFEFHARIDREMPAADPMSLEAALIEAVRLMDEAARVDRRSFPPCSTLSAEGSPGDPCLSKLDQAVIDLATAGMTVQRVLDIIPETDAEIYLALERLMDDGLIAVRA